MSMKFYPHRGYTLLELIVSVGIFSMVMLAATSAYLSLVATDRQARATADVVTNLSFAVDSMTREIRTGTAYKCNNSSGTPNCTATPGTSFGFTDSRSPARTIIYSVVNHQLMVSINGVVSSLTDPRVSVDALSFYVRGVGTTGGDALIQPQVLLTLRGTLQTKDKSIAFSIQSSAEQRYLDLP